jgi:transaldolase
MNGKGYFHRVHEQTPTRFWINNPTRREAKLAIGAGAVGCTTNPTHTAKMLSSADDGELARANLKRAAAEAKDAREAAVLAQRRMVSVLLEEFLSVFRSGSAGYGYVSIQGDPYAENDSGNIINEALADMKLGQNVIAKIPVTRAGLEAIEYLTAKNVPIIATEIMGVAQMIAACEASLRARRKSGFAPVLYVTHITGIFDEYLQGAAAGDKVDIPYDVLYQAGTAVARKQYRLMRERGYPGVMLGGGARGLQHFTEMVGGALHVTINWSGTADKLIELDPPVLCRMDEPTPEYVLDELMRALPDFTRAWRSDGLSVDEFADFGPVALFRSRFIAGWDKLLEAVKAEGAKT